MKQWKCWLWVACSSSLWGKVSTSLWMTIEGGKQIAHSCTVLGADGPFLALSGGQWGVLSKTLEVIKGNLFLPETSLTTSRSLEEHLWSWTTFWEPLQQNENESICYHYSLLKIAFLLLGMSWFA